MLAVVPFVKLHN